MPNTQKQKEGSYQIEETKKHGPKERTQQNSKKELNETEIVNLSDAEFKTLGVRMLQELIGYFSSIIKTQAKMKVTLSEIKKNIQGTKTGGDEAENQINDLEHKEEKSIKSEWQEEKRI